jgi:hypothetical protein
MMVRQYTRGDEPREGPDRDTRSSVNDTRRLALGCALLVSILLAGDLLDRSAAQNKPEGEMRWALYVTLSPVWLDPGEVVGYTFDMVREAKDALAKLLRADARGVARQVAPPVEAALLRRTAWKSGSRSSPAV